MPGPMKMKEHQRAKKGTLKRLLKLLFTKFPFQLSFCAICLIITVIANLSASVFANFITVAITQAIDGETIYNPFVESHELYAMGITVNTNITVLLIILGSIYLVAIFASWYWNRTMGIITQKFLNEIREKMFNHMQSLPIKYFDTHPHGDIMSIYTNDIDTIRQFVSQALPTLFSGLLAVIFVFVSMLLNSIWMTLIVILCTIAMMIVTKQTGGKASKYFIKQQQQVGIVEGKIQESIKGLKVIKVFTHEDKSCEEFDAMNETLRDYSTTANIQGNITGPINMNIGNIMYVLTAVTAFAIIAIPGFKNVALTSSYEINSNTIHTFIGAIVSFLMMCRSFTNNVNNVANQVTFIVMGMAGASRCFDLLDEKEEIDDGYVYLCNVIRHDDGTFEETQEHTHDYMWKYPHKDGRIEYKELKGDIEIKNVVFSYNGKRNHLDDVTIWAKAGEKIAFVGATGAGKTTITNLINRFYEIQEGKIYYDGINIQKIKKDDLRRSLGIVLQDTALFSGTVMENIRYGRLDATDEEVIEAAKIANAYEFITRLPNGFNTMLAGDGSNISQGQRQLLAIARAAVADAPVMILDEATSSIDTRTEKLVQDGTDKLMKGRTVFVIAHRLSTVQNAEAIIVLEHGKIIERGSHEELIAKHGTYYQLYTGAFELE